MSSWYIFIGGDFLDNIWLKTISLNFVGFGFRRHLQYNYQRILQFPDFSKKKPKTRVTIKDSKCQKLQSVKNISIYTVLYYASLPHDQKHVVLPTLGRPGPLSTIFKAL